MWQPPERDDEAEKSESAVKFLKQLKGLSDYDYKIVESELIEMMNQKRAKLGIEGEVKAQGTVDYKLEGKKKS